MDGYRYSAHAVRRMRQRGIGKRDIELIFRCGTEVRRGLRLLRGRDIDAEITRIKRRVQDLERLRDCAVVVEGKTDITRYHLFGRAGRRALNRDGRRSRRSRRRR